jgi:hypothetical protein
MKVKKLLVVLTAGVISLELCPLAARASVGILAPSGGSANIGSPGTGIAGTQLYDSGALAWSNGSGYSGTLETVVYQNDSDNTLGGDTFEFIISNAASSIDVIDRLRLGPWSTGIVYVDNYNPLVTGISATEATRSASGTIGFDWNSTEIPAGGYGIVIVQTSFTGPVALQTVYIDDNTADGTGQALLPDPVPETPTMMAGALLLLPFGASVLRILCKKLVA